MRRVRPAEGLQKTDEVDWGFKVTNLLIKTVDLAKDYCMGPHRVHALQNITVAVERGEFLAVMGPSGSGQSTLMNIKKDVLITSPQTSVDMGILLEGDVNQDNIVNFNDYAVLSTCWLTSEKQAEYNVGVDFDRNGTINTVDLSLFAENWLRNSPVEILP